MQGLGSLRSGWVFRHNQHEWIPVPIYIYLFSCTIRAHSRMISLQAPSRQRSVSNLSLCELSGFFFGGGAGGFASLSGHCTLFLLGMVILAMLASPSNSSLTNNCFVFDNERHNILSPHLTSPCLDQCHPLVSIIRVMHTFARRL